VVRPTTISEPVVCSTQTMQLTCIMVSTISKWTETSTIDPCHLGVPSGPSETISEPMVRLAQIMNPSSIDTNTISKRIEMRFHMTHVTLVFYQVCPK
jgi:hypothetical protein